MLPKNKASRAQQYLMYFYSNGRVLLFQLYYNKNIVVFLYSNKSSSRFTSHSSYSEKVLKPKKKRESPYCVQRTSGALTGWLSSQHTKGQKCKIALRKGSFSTAIGKSGKHTEDK